MNETTENIGSSEGQQAIEVAFADCHPALLGVMQDKDFQRLPHQTKQVHSQSHNVASTLTESVRSLLLAQPLNGLERAEFSVWTQANPASGGRSPMRMEQCEVNCGSISYESRGVL